ncbi:MAG: alpha-amylase family glycosyl hydrolase [Chloroflexi bacterium]|nr:alpha-amylase family glycosyl hydrolase [Chloroflexota bacterium]
MDHTFGKLISDELKLTDHRANFNGLQHQHNISPLDPAPGESVNVYVVTASDTAIARIKLHYTADGTDPRAGGSSVRRVAFRLAHTEWDTLVWDYISYWSAQIPAQLEGTMVSYFISGTTRAGDVIYADFPDAEERVEHATMLHFKNIPPDTPFKPSPQTEAPLFCYHVDRIKPPAWVGDAIIYHIFLDRFYPGDGADWRQTTDMLGICGGTLWGVRDKLDYLEELGINCLWLSPTWKSPSHHGYDVMDYEQIEPRFGGEEALHALVEDAHQRGIRVLLDLVCNHLSNEHPIFLDAASSEDSRYRNWFTFDDRYLNGYRCFFNVKTMPKINLETPAAREWMIDMAIKQLQVFDVDGFRLDVAAGAGPNFWTHCRPRLRAVKPDCFIVGEIIDKPAYLRMYKGKLDGCLDFSMNEALRKTYGWESWDEPRLEAFIESHRAYFGENFVLPSFIDNHDMDRFSFIVDNDSEKTKRAVERQMRLPNTPIIYYGNEVGLRQPLSTREHSLDANRVPMVWDERQDRDLLAYYKDLIRQRKAASW